jgi:hypothetical protein
MIYSSFIYRSAVPKEAIINHLWGFRKGESEDPLTHTRTHTHTARRTHSFYHRIHAYYNRTIVEIISRQIISLHRKMESLSQVFIVASNNGGSANGGSHPNGQIGRLKQILSQIPVSNTTVTSVEEIFAGYRPNLEMLAYLRLCIIFEYECTERAVFECKQRFPTVFICVFNPQLADKPLMKLEYHRFGVNQVAYEVNSIVKIVRENIIFERRERDSDGRHSCHFCPMSGLTEDELWRQALLSLG